ncbi:hypothetical protein EBU71_18935, partial [bacterium]|nr:hypothetical protein [Candidatus Elulimicrobium humile]
SETIAIVGTDAATIAGNINQVSDYIKAGVSKNGRLVLYMTGQNSFNNLGGPALPDLGLSPGFIFDPIVTIASHTSVPAYKKTDNYPRPTGSVWIKTTEPGNGASLVVKKYNSDSDAWELLPCPLYANGHQAINQLDKSGGLNIPSGTIYAKFNFEELFRSNYGGNVVRSCDTKLFRKRAFGSTVIESKKIETAFGFIFTPYTGQDADFDISESRAGSDILHTVNIVYTIVGDITDADGIAGAINNAGLTNIIAEVDEQNRVKVSHKLGGDFRLNDNSSFNFLETLFLGVSNPNLYTSPSGDSNHEWLISLWEPLRYTASSIAPTSLTKDGTLWYSSIVDEVDIMGHNGQKWVGYRQLYPNTDINGPLVSATAPSIQSNGVSPLVDNDLWIDTSDIDLYPKLYRFDDSKTGPIPTRWVLVDKTDQSTEEGVLFADARWNITGEGKDPATISQLLLSDHVDPDCPDPALYPKGMLLWNMRRSGFNVKQFKQN